MPGVNAEQMEQAKQWDLLSYLQQYEPGELKKTGPHEFRTVTHDSLKISNGKWNWTTWGLWRQDRAGLPYGQRYSCFCYYE